MDTISEPVLADNARNGSVTSITAVPTSDRKGFHIHVTLSWKEGQFLLVGQKKNPRVWKSVDRLFSHINEHYEEIAKFSIFLKNFKDPSSGQPPS